LQGVVYKKEGEVVGYSLQNRETPSFEVNFQNEKNEEKDSEAVTEFTEIIASRVAHGKEKG
jgi:hypothetical protein